VQIGAGNFTFYVNRDPHRERQADAAHQRYQPSGMAPKRWPTSLVADNARIDNSKMDVR
jgi:hypothetical protein